MVKNIKLLKHAFAAAMIAALLMLINTIPAFPDNNYSKGESAAEPARAAVTKIFKMPAGTPVPEATFTFEFEAIGMNEPIDESPDAKLKMPDIGPVEIKFDEDFIEVTENDMMALKKQVEFINASIAEGLVWGNGEGVYRYMLSEAQSGILINESDTGKAGCEYSKAKYEIEIWVTKDDMGILYPKFVVAQIVNDPINEYVFVDEYYIKEDGTKTEKSKVDPTPDGADTYSGLVFTNKYWKTEGGGIDYPEESTLEIIKKVEGMGAIYNKAFDFFVTVTQPDFITEKQTFKAVVLDRSGNDVTAETGYESLINGHIEIESGAELKIKLMHDQRLVFVDLLVGTDVKAYEIPTNDYKPSYIRKFHDADEIFGAAGDVKFGFPSTSDKGLHLIIPGTKENIVTFTNSRTGATPTGISVDDLPYIVMIGVAAIGFMCFTVLKNRKKTEPELYQDEFFQDN